MTDVLSFAATERDSLALVNHILGMGTTRIILDRWFSKPAAVLLDSCPRELDSDYPHFRSLFLWDSRYSKRPVYFSKNQGASPDGDYRIWADRGGPILSLTLPANFEQSGRAVIAAGTLSCAETYVDDPHGEFESRRLGRAFLSEVRRAFDAVLVERKIDGKSRLLGPECLQGWTAGEIQVRW